MSRPSKEIMLQKEPNAQKIETNQNLKRDIIIY